MQLHSVFRMSIALAALSAIAPQAQAAACAGFSDVDSASSFCKGVEWVKNRAITVGCLGGGQYCPDEPVTRADMAAFLMRLGNVGVPAYTNFGCVTAASGPNIPAACTTTIPAAAYPRTFQFDGDLVLTGGTIDPSGTVQVEPDYSLDDGATWDSLASLNPLRTVPGTGSITGQGLPLPANKTLKLRVAATGFGASNYTMSFAYRVRIDNGKSAVSPF